MKMTPESNIEKLLAVWIQEQRRARIGKNIFRGMILVVLLLILFSASNKNKLIVHGMESKHVALVRIDGVIDGSGPNSAQVLSTALKDAFESPNSVAVFLHINSPGGSPVQSDLIYNEIKKLRGVHNKPIYTIVDDLCASGGYYVASATDKIYVNPSSMVGSIGVLMDGFGFTGLMDKLGVERRLLTAGTHKGMLDPFLPVKPEEKQRVEEMLADVHKQFINAVRAGRGARLKLDTPDLFSGLIWTGQKAVDIGLVDAFGSVNSIASGAFGTTNIVDYTLPENVVDRITKNFGVAFGQGVASTLMIQKQGLR